MVGVVRRAPAILGAILLLILAGCASDPGATAIPGSTESPPVVHADLAPTTRPVESFAEPGVKIWFPMDDDLDHVTRTFMVSAADLEDSKEASLSMWIRPGACAPETLFALQVNEAAPRTARLCEGTTLDQETWVNVSFEADLLSAGINTFTLWQPESPAGHVDLRAGMVTMRPNATQYVQHDGPTRFAFDLFWALTLDLAKRPLDGPDSGVLEDVVRLDTDDDRISIRVPAATGKEAYLQVFGRHYNCPYGANGQAIGQEKVLQIRAGLQGGGRMVDLGAVDPCTDARAEFDWISIPLDNEALGSLVPLGPASRDMLWITLVDTSHWRASNLMIGTTPGDRSTGHVEQNEQVRDGQVPMMRLLYIQ